MARYVRLFVVLVTVLAAGVLLTRVTTAQAANDGTPRPGWGKGDLNHEHTGPPGQSSAPLPGNADGHSGAPGHP